MLHLDFDPAKCAACRTQSCLVRCQYLRLDQDTAKREIDRLIDGEDSFVLDRCVTCYACEEYCEMGNHPFFLIVERQEEKGILPAPRPLVTMMVDQFEPRGKYRVGQLSGTALSFCFAPPLEHMATGRLFDGLASSYVFGREFACPAFYLHYGRAALLKERLPALIERIEQLGITRLLCLHDECFASFTSLAPAYGLEVPFEPVHYFEHLRDRLTELQGEVKPLGVTVVYQRPCSARLHPQTDHLVDEVFELVGARRLEREYHGENALCCGETLRSNKGFDLADDVQSRNVDDMEKTGAEYCVFNCPYCYYALVEQLGKRGIKSVHMIDLCKMAIGEVPAFPG